MQTRGSAKSDYTITSVKTIAQTKWLRLEELTFVDQKQRTRTWDRVVRSTTKDDTSADAGVAVTLGLKDGIPGLICVCQFRPPVRQLALEFPAGLVDHNETPEASIHRELKEETGYEAEAIYVSPRLVLSPGMGCESIVLSLMYADPENPVNATPEASPDETEDIEVMFLPLKNLRQQLDRLSAQGILVFDAVYTFAMGLEVAEAFGGKLENLKDLGPSLRAMNQESTP
eukprot:Protomagalhaensia_wolfi_Nauph_80__4879@NODE_511_length_2409_cov_8_337131_g381_i0_p2_GENE_NODE_511_length_2409_cov_8_337131_g381_i0NODE_511_length_2409_cov_8_337131_g381_i0_p2_ORF_typecomplete_len245_score48_00NUDIX/PF00293_28/2_3e02NUDIX/PF00293_28/1e11DUF1917/PF08939_10/0_057_NODE_511_length_2409_cov_8_337131_g381_i051737